MRPTYILSAGTGSEGSPESTQPALFDACDLQEPAPLRPGHPWPDRRPSCGATPGVPASSLADPVYDRCDRVLGHPGTTLNSDSPFTRPVCHRHHLGRTVARARAVRPVRTADTDFENALKARGNLKIPTWEQWLASSGPPATGPQID